MTEIFHKAIIVVIDEDDSFLLDSEPNILNEDVFDGTHLQDQISEYQTVPKEPGVYRCSIRVVFTKSWTDCGYEYDRETEIIDPQKIELPSIR